MSAEMDKFVLQYQVELKDAVQRLEQLNEKVKSVNEGAKKGKSEFVDFSQKAGDEIGKLIPGVEKVTGVVRAMGAEFAIAAIAISALAIGVKSVIDMRAQYGQQRLAGMDVGVSGMRMEEYQRKFVKQSGGMINREDASEQIKNLSNRLQAAYADPTRNGTEARTFRMLGVNVGARGQGQTGFNDAFGQLATRFSQMSPEKVQGVAKAIGMQQDFALALQKIGPSISKVTETSAAEVNSRKNAEASLAQFNSELAKFEEQTKRLSNTLGEGLIPAFTALIKLINDAVDAIPKTVTNARHIGGKDGQGGVDAIKAGDTATRWGAGAILGPMGAAYSIGSWASRLGRKKEHEQDKPDDDKSWLARFSKKIDKNQKSDNLPTTKPTSAKSQTAADPKVQSLDAVVTAMDKNNDTSVRTATDMQMAINMFSGAVTTFANAIDERQAWAAWAGEAGRAAGLSAPIGVGGSGVSGVARGVGSTDFDAIFEREARSNGMTPDILKRIAKVESHFNPNALGAVTSDGSRAEGLMQIMPANKKALGIRDSFDPEQNIAGGAKLMADFLKRSGGNIREALMMYHGGLDRKGWGPKTRAYPDKVLGDLGEVTAGGGESKSTIKRRLVQQNIANNLGVPLEQIQQGAVNRGDAAWASQQLQAGVANNIFNIQKELMNEMLPQSTRSQKMNELREQQTGLQQLQQYAPGVVEAQRQGDRSITIGANAIMINILGAGEPAAIARETKDQLQNGLGDIVNHANDGVKY